MGLCPSKALRSPNDLQALEATDAKFLSGDMDFETYLTTNQEIDLPKIPSTEAFSFTPIPHDRRHCKTDHGEAIKQEIIRLWMRQVGERDSVKMLGSNLQSLRKIGLSYMRQTIRIKKANRRTLKQSSDVKVLPLAQRLSLRASLRALLLLIRAVQQFDSTLLDNILSLTQELIDDVNEALGAKIHYFSGGTLEGEISDAISPLFDFLLDQCKNTSMGPSTREKAISVSFGMALVRGSTHSMLQLVEVFLSPLRSEILVIPQHLINALLADNLELKKPETCISFLTKTLTFKEFLKEYPFTRSEQEKTKGIVTATVKAPGKALLENVCLMLDKSYNVENVIVLDLHVLQWKDQTGTISGRRPKDKRCFQILIGNNRLSLKPSNFTMVMSGPGGFEAKNLENYMSEKEFLKIRIVLKSQSGEKHVVKLMKKWTLEKSPKIASWLWENPKILENGNFTKKTLGFKVEGSAYLGTVNVYLGNPDEIPPFWSGLLKDGPKKQFSGILGADLPPWVANYDSTESHLSSSPTGKDEMHPLQISAIICAALDRKLATDKTEIFADNTVNAVGVLKLETLRTIANLMGIIKREMLAFSTTSKEQPMSEQYQNLRGYILKALLRQSTLHIALVLGQPIKNVKDIELKELTALIKREIFSILEMDTNESQILIKEIQEEAARCLTSTLQSCFPKVRDQVKFLADALESEQMSSHRVLMTAMLERFCKFEYSFLLMDLKPIDVFHKESAQEARRGLSLVFDRLFEVAVAIPANQRQETEEDVKRRMNATDALFNLGKHLMVKASTSWDTMDNKKLNKIVCPRGHKLDFMWSFELAWEQPDYSLGYSCDNCSNCWDPMLNYVFHCQPCGYDICPQCMEPVVEFLRGHWLNALIDFCERLIAASSKIVHSILEDMLAKQFAEWSGKNTCTPTHGDSTTYDECTLLVRKNLPILIALTELLGKSNKDSQRMKMKKLSWACKLMNPLSMLVTNLDKLQWWTRKTEWPIIKKCQTKKIEETGLEMLEKKFEHYFKDAGEVVVELNKNTHLPENYCVSIKWTDRGENKSRILSTSKLMNTRILSNRVQLEVQRVSTDTARRESFMSFNEEKISDENMSLDDDTKSELEFEIPERKIEMIKRLYLSAEIRGVTKITPWTWIPRILKSAACLLGQLGGALVITIEPEGHRWLDTIRSVSPVYRGETTWKNGLKFKYVGDGNGDIIEVNETGDIKVMDYFPSGTKQEDLCLCFEYFTPTTSGDHKMIWSMDDSWKDWIVAAFSLTRLSKLFKTHYEKILRIFASVLAVVLNFEAINMKELKEKGRAFHSLQTSRKILTCIYVSEEIVASMLRKLFKLSEKLDLVEAKLNFIQVEHTLLSSRNSPAFAKMDEPSWVELLSKEVPKVLNKGKQKCGGAFNKLMITTLKRTECILQFGPEKWMPLDLQADAYVKKVSKTENNSSEAKCGDIKYNVGNSCSTPSSFDNQTTMNSQKLNDVDKPFTEANYSSQWSIKNNSVFPQQDMKILSEKLREYLWLLAFLGETENDTAKAVNDAVISHQIRVHTVCWAYAMIMLMVKTLNCNDVLLELLTFFTRTLTTQDPKIETPGLKRATTYQVWFDSHLKEKNTFYKELVKGLIERLDDPMKRGTPKGSNIHNQLRLLTIAIFNMDNSDVWEEEVFEIFISEKTAYPTTLSDLLDMKIGHYDKISEKDPNEQAKVSQSISTIQKYQWKFLCGFLKGIQMDQFKVQLISEKVDGRKQSWFERDYMFMMIKSLLPALIFPGATESITAEFAEDLKKNADAIFSPFYYRYGSYLLIRRIAGKLVQSFDLCNYTKSNSRRLHCVNIITGFLIKNLKILHGMIQNKDCLSPLLATDEPNIWHKGRPWVIDGKPAHYVQIEEFLISDLCSKDMRFYIGTEEYDKEDISKDIIDCLSKAFPQSEKLTTIQLFNVLKKNVESLAKKLKIFSNSLICRKEGTNLENELRTACISYEKFVQWNGFSTDFHLSLFTSNCEGNTIQISKGTSFEKNVCPHGLLHFMGSLNNTLKQGSGDTWINPTNMGLIKVISSDLAPGSLSASYVLGATPQRVITKIFQDAYIEIDFLEMGVSLEHYALIHLEDWKGGVLRNWMLKGQRRGSSMWEDLAQHRNDKTLPEKRGAVAMYVIKRKRSSGNLSLLLNKNTEKRFYNKLRLQLTGPNSAGKHYIALGGIEFFGKLYLGEKSSASKIGLNYLHAPKIWWSTKNQEEENMDLMHASRAEDPDDNKVLKARPTTMFNRGTNNRWRATKTEQIFVAGKNTLIFVVVADTHTTNTWKLIVGLMPPNWPVNGPKRYVGSCGGWGYIAGNGGKNHDSGQFTEYGERFTTGDTIRMEFDFDQKTIEFFKNGKTQGVAFNNLNGPVVGAASCTGKNAGVLIQSPCEFIRKCLKPMNRKHWIKAKAGSSFKNGIFPIQRKSESTQRKWTKGNNEANWYRTNLKQVGYHGRPAIRVEAPCAEEIEIYASGYLVMLSELLYWNNVKKLPIPRDIHQGILESLPMLFTFAKNGPHYTQQLSLTCLRWVIPGVSYAFDNDKAKQVNEKASRLVEMLTKLAYERKGDEASNWEQTDLDKIIKYLLSSNEWSDTVLGKLLEVNTMWKNGEVSEKNYLGMLQILTHWIAKGSSRLKHSKYFSITLQQISKMIKQPTSKMNLHERIFNLKLNKMAITAIEGLTCTEWIPLIIKQYSKILDILIERVKMQPMQNQIKFKAWEERPIKYWSARTKEICSAKKREERKSIPMYFDFGDRGFLHYLGWKTKKEIPRGNIIADENLGSQETDECDEQKWQNPVGPNGSFVEVVFCKERDQSKATWATTPFVTDNIERHFQEGFSFEFTFPFHQLLLSYIMLIFPDQENTSFSFSGRNSIEEPWQRITLDFKRIKNSHYPVRSSVFYSMFKVEFLECVPLQEVEFFGKAQALPADIAQRDQGKPGVFQTWSLNEFAPGDIYVFGKAENGRLGLGSTSDIGEPTYLPFDEKVTHISCFGAHVLALTSSGTAYSWGKGDNGRLGHGSTNNLFTPKEIVFSDSSKRVKIKKVHAGLGFSALLDREGRVWCFGQGANGQLGQGNTVDIKVPTLVMALIKKGISVVEIGVGGSHVIACTTKGHIYVWGKNQYGQLGIGNTLGKNVPLQMPASSVTSELQQKIVQLVGGWEHSMALTEHGRLFTWGAGYEGSRPVCGHGTSEKQLVPKLVETLKNHVIVHIAAGWDHSLCVTNAGLLFTWGGNSGGSLGHGERHKALVPTQVLGSLASERVIWADGGQDHSACVTEKGELWTWGSLGKHLGQGDEYKAMGSSKKLYPQKVVSRNIASVVFQKCCSGDKSNWCLTSRSNIKVPTYPYGKKTDIVPRPPYPDGAFFLEGPPRIKEIELEYGKTISYIHNLADNDNPVILKTSGIECSKSAEGVVWAHRESEIIYDTKDNPLAPKNSISRTGFVLHAVADISSCLELREFVKVTSESKKFSIQVLAKRDQLYFIKKTPNGSEDQLVPALRMKAITVKLVDILLIYRQKENTIELKIDKVSGNLLTLDQIIGDATLSLYIGNVGMKNIMIWHECLKTAELDLISEDWIHTLNEAYKSEEMLLLQGEYLNNLFFRKTEKNIMKGEPYIFNLERQMKKLKLDPSGVLLSKNFMIKLFIKVPDMPKNMLQLLRIMLLPYLQCHQALWLNNNGELSLMSHNKRPQKALKEKGSRLQKDQWHEITMQIYMDEGLTELFLSGKKLTLVAAPSKIDCEEDNGPPKIVLGGKKSNDSSGCDLVATFSHIRFYEIHGANYKKYDGKEKKLRRSSTKRYCEREMRCLGFRTEWLETAWCVMLPRMNDIHFVPGPGIMRKLQQYIFNLEEELEQADDKQYLLKCASRLTLLGYKKKYIDSVILKIYKRFRDDRHNKDFKSIATNHALVSKIFEHGISELISAWTSKNSQRAAVGITDRDTSENGLCDSDKPSSLLRMIHSPGEDSTKIFSDFGNDNSSDLEREIELLQLEFRKMKLPELAKQEEISRSNEVRLLAQKCLLEFATSGCLPSPNTIMTLFKLSNQGVWWIRKELLYTIKAQLKVELYQVHTLRSMPVNAKQSLVMQLICYATFLMLNKIWKQPNMSIKNSLGSNSDLLHICCVIKEIRGSLIEQLASVKPKDMTKVWLRIFPVPFMDVSFAYIKNLPNDMVLQTEFFRLLSSLVSQNVSFGLYAPNYVIMLAVKKSNQWKLTNNDKIEEGNDAHIQAMTELAIQVEGKIRIAQRTKAETQRVEGRAKNERKLERRRKQIIEESLQEVLIPVPRDIYEEEAEFELGEARNGIFNYLRKWASASAKNNLVESKLVEVWAECHEKTGLLCHLLANKTANIRLISVQPYSNPNTPTPIDGLLEMSKPAIMFWLRHHELKLSGYHLQTARYIDTNFPHTWSIDGSPDGGKTWTNIAHEVANMNFSSSSQWAKFKCQEEQPYFSFFRIIAESKNVDGKVTLCLGGIELMGAVRSLVSKNKQTSDTPVRCIPESLLYKCEIEGDGISSTCCKRVSLPQQLSSTSCSRLIMILDSLVQPSAYIVAFNEENINGIRWILQGSNQQHPAKWTTLHSFSSFFEKRYKTEDKPLNWKTSTRFELMGKKHYRKIQLVFKAAPSGCAVRQFDILITSTKKDYLKKHIGWKDKGFFHWLSTNQGRMTDRRKNPVIHGYVIASGRNVSQLNDFIFNPKRSMIFVTGAREATMVFKFVKHKIKISTLKLFTKEKQKCSQIYVVDVLSTKDQWRHLDTLDFNVKNIICTRHFHDTDYTTAIRIIATTQEPSPPNLRFWRWQLNALACEIYGDVVELSNDDTFWAEGVDSSGKIFTFQRDFDQNGIIWWLGTCGNSEKFISPVTRKICDVKFSTIMPDSKPVNFFTDRQTVRCVTRSEEQQWMMIHFLHNTVQPTAYSLRHYSSWDNEALRNWEFQASNDGENWVTLRRHDNDTSLFGKGATFTWEIKPSKDSSKPWSRFRLYQFGKNSNSHKYLACSGFEIFGVLDKHEKEALEVLKSINVLHLPTVAPAIEDHQRKKKEPTLICEQQKLPRGDTLPKGIIKKIGNWQNGEDPESWINPVDLCEVDVQWDGLEVECENVKELLNPSTKSQLFSENDENASFVVNFRHATIQPTAYALSNYAIPDRELLRNWNLEGMERFSKKWDILVRHQDDESLTKEHQVAVWSIPLVNEKKSYSRFRIKLTGSNSSGNQVLACGAFEIYGKLTSERQTLLQFSGFVLNMNEPTAGRRFFGVSKKAGRSVCNFTVKRGLKSGTWQTTHTKIERSGMKLFRFEIFCKESECSNGETKSKPVLGIGVVTLEEVAMCWCTKINLGYFDDGTIVYDKKTYRTTPFTARNTVSMLLDFEHNLVIFGLNGKPRFTLYNCISGPLFPAVSTYEKGALVTIPQMRKLNLHSKSMIAEPILSKYPFDRDFLTMLNELIPYFCSQRTKRKLSKKLWEEIRAEFIAGDCHMSKLAENAKWMDTIIAELDLFTPRHDIAIVHLLEPISSRRDSLTRIAVNPLNISAGSFKVQNKYILKAFDLDKFSLEALRIRIWFIQNFNKKWIQTTYKVDRTNPVGVFKAKWMSIRQFIFFECKFKIMHRLLTKTEVADGEGDSPNFDSFAELGVSSNICDSNMIEWAAKIQRKNVLASPMHKWKLLTRKNERGDLIGQLQELEFDSKMLRGSGTNQGAIFGTVEPCPPKKMYELLNKELEIALPPTLILCKSNYFSMGEHRDKVLLKRLTESSKKPKHSSELELIGMLMGRRFRTGDGVQPPFAPIVWKALAGEDLTLRDAALIDPVIMRNITEMAASTKALDWYLKLRLKDIKSNVKQSNRILGLSSKEVTSALGNLIEPYYIEKEAQQILNGIGRVIPYPFLDVLCPHEWEEIFSAHPHCLQNLSLLKQQATYKGYTRTSKTIELFWEAVLTFTAFDNWMLVRWLTGNCNRLTNDYHLEISGPLSGAGTGESPYLTRTKNGCRLYIPKQYKYVDEMHWRILGEALSYHFDSIFPLSFKPS